MKVMNLPHWPPTAIPPRSGVTAIFPEDVILRQVTRIDKDQVEFNGDLNGALIRYTQKTPDEWTARRLGEIIVTNLGKTVFSLGMIEIPEE